MKNAVIFIDGNNFYHNVKLMKVKPSHINFEKLANLISKNFKCNLKEVRYYNSIPNIRDGKELYYSHLKFLNSLQKIPKFTVHTRKLQVHSNKEILKEMKELIDSIDLCKTCKPIVEQNFLDVIGKVEKKEKGIDVMIAVDIVNYSIKNKGDVIILVSGDADFIPALNLAKENKGEIFSTSLARGYSSELRTSFRYLILNRDLIMEHCLK